VTTDPVLNQERHGQVVLLELNRPRARNALSTALLDELVGTLHRLAGDDGCRAVVLAGAGPAFCAGADLRELEAMDDVTFAAYVDRLRVLGEAIRDLGRPVVAAVHGHAVAGGFELVCLCDLRIVADDARLRVGDLEIGLSPTSGLSWLLPRLVGDGRARWLLMAGPVLDGPQAVAIGLAEESLPADQVRDRALAVAGRIAAFPGTGVARTRELFETGWSSTRDQAVRAELVAEAETFAHPDARTAIAAVLRRP
jgi:enoyl-CoA hydratase/carnithine racemase